MSAARDARVLIESLDELVARRNLEPAESASFRAALRQEQRELRRELAGEDRGFRRTRTSLRAARDRAASSKLDSRGWPDLGDGLQRIYAHGRKALRAARSQCTPERLHEWRKQSKYLLYQLQLLASISPKRIDRIAQRAHGLSNRLGDDHDLSMLRRKAVAHRSAFRAPGELDALFDAIEHRQSSLRRKAFKIGAKLYDARPARFRKRFDRYWKRAA